MNIYNNYIQIANEISAAALECNRKPADILLLPISKTVPVEQMKELLDNKINIFGESKIQETKLKYSELAPLAHFHLVGHLQSNKARQGVEYFELIHSIDKASTASAVNQEAAKIGKKQKILIEVNTSNETSKNGIEPDKTLELCREIIDLPNIDLQGLMTIGPNTADNNLIRDSFKKLADLREEINQKLNISLKELSMGMSHDYKLAIKEGSTIVRIGSAIFGERIYK